MYEHTMRHGPTDSQGRVVKPRAPRGARAHWPTVIDIQGGWSGEGSVKKLWFALALLESCEIKPPRRLSSSAVFEKDASRAWFKPPVDAASEITRQFLR